MFADLEFDDEDYSSPAKKAKLLDGDGDLDGDGALDPETEGDGALDQEAEDAMNGGCGFWYMPPQ